MLTSFIFAYFEIRFFTCRILNFRLLNRYIFSKKLYFLRKIYCNTESVLQKIIIKMQNQNSTRSHVPGSITEPGKCLYDLEFIFLLRTNTPKYLCIVCVHGTHNICIMSVCVVYLLLLSSLTSI